MDAPLVKYPYVGNIRWAFWKWADIAYARDPRYVYLRRLRVIQTPWCALYLHWIFLTDDDRDPHDHPINFWSFIWRGGYTERVYWTNRATNQWGEIDSRHSPRRWRRFSLHYMRVGRAHQITQLEPGTMTVLFVGRRNKQRWGFWTPEGYVPFDQYKRG